MSYTTLYKTITCPTEWYMSNGHSGNLRMRYSSSDWVKVDFLIQDPAAADTSRIGMIFDQWDARRYPVSLILIGRKWPLDMYHTVGHISPCIMCTLNKFMGTFFRSYGMSHKNVLNFYPLHISPCIMCTLNKFMGTFFRSYGMSHKNVLNFYPVNIIVASSSWWYGCPGDTHFDGTYIGVYLLVAFRYPHRTRPNFGPEN